MQNVLKRKKYVFGIIYLVIFNFFPQNLMFKTILTVLICISKNYFKKHIFFGRCPQKTGFFLPTDGGQRVTDMSATNRIFFTPSLKHCQS